MGNASDPSAEQILQQARTVHVALIAGIVVFAGVAAFVGPIAPGLKSIAYGLDPVALAALLVLGATIPASMFLPPRIVDAARQRELSARRAAFSSSRIVPAAMLEGAALLWCVAILLSGNLWFLLPVAGLVSLMAVGIPTREGYESATGERIPGD
jgi:predicted small integral membrane protein